jgi:hypothetical protein
MSGLNPSISQQDILSYIKQQFPNYVVYENSVLDDEYILKIGNKVKPYIVIGFGGLYQNSRGGSFAGVRYDEYSTTIDVTVIAPTSKQSQAGANVIIDRLIGYEPNGGSPLSLQGTTTSFGVPDLDGLPHVYLASQRFIYQLTTQNTGSYIQP